MMKYSRLSALLVTLLASYGEVSPEDSSDFQEDCCGEGLLSAGVRLYGLKAGRRDVPWRVAMLCMRFVGLRYSAIRAMTSRLGWASWQLYKLRLACYGSWLAFLEVRSLKEGCLWWVGVPCSTFVWVSRGSTGRSITRPGGKRHYKEVARANRLVRRICYLQLGSFLM